MLRSKITFCLLLISALAFSQNADSIYQVQQRQIRELEQKIQSAENQNKIIGSKLNELSTKISSLSSENVTLNTALLQKQHSIDSLQKQVAMNSANIQATADSLGIRIQTTDKAVTQNADNLKTKTLWGIVAIVIALLVSVIVALLLHKKGQKSSDEKISKLKQQADDLNEKIVNQFSTEMGELQKIGEVLKTAGGNALAEPDHSLVKTLADRITFMEITLFRMDKSVKGHKQLSKSIIQMKDNLLANGYEIVDMLGKDYNDGMKVTANFVEDETLETGKQIITGIVKPQINYNGVMIQSAQITVSQN